MYSKIMSSAVKGIDGTIISVEADVHDGLPSFTMVGYLSSSVKEAGERVRTALKNSGYHLPPKRITINLSPADIRKEGSGFDLPIAISVLCALGITSEVNLDKTIIIGELGLDGRVCAIPGVLAMVHYCFTLGFSDCIVPYENAEEASLIKGINIYPVKTLDEAISYVQGIIKIKPYIASDKAKNQENTEDFSEIKGQEVIKRGMEIAAAGFHNLLMNGAAGAGKSMLAKRFPGIMPELTHSESIEVTKVYSVSGLLKDNSALITRRPFRAPHHSISTHALVGGGTQPKPGEISLAHRGVLFLDELPEFNKKTLEVMRQPLEDRCVTISRVNATYTFPAEFLLLAAMNNCPCGAQDSMKCTCTLPMIQRYHDKISVPLLDRIDINMRVKAIEYNELFLGKEGESTKQIRNRVLDAIERQKIRYKDEGIDFNSELSGAQIKKYVRLKEKEQELLKEAFERYNLSARGTYRILKLARTIADLAGFEEINAEHLSEAIFYRNNGLEK